MKILILLISFPFFLWSQNHELEKLIKEVNPHGFTGFMLYDAVEQDTLFRYHSDRYFLPASNAKIFTFAILAQSLKDSIPTLFYAKQNDTLYIRPLADPTVLDSRFSSENIYNLLQHHTGVMALDLEFFESAYAPGWSWDDFDQEYMPERSIFPLFRNLVSENSDAHFDFDSIHFKRKLHQNVFNNSVDINTPFIVSDSLITYILKKEFNLKNIIVSHFPKTLHYQTLYSNPTTIVLQEMMLESDNFIAEQLLIQQILLDDSNKKFTSVQQFWEDCWEDDIQPQPKLVDASGLSRYDLVTPQNIVQVLALIQKRIPHYLSYFPENGVSGTLQNSYLKEKSYLYAKTGSMSGVFNLSGYVRTDSGKLLIFSFLNNNQREKGSQLKPRMEEVLRYIKHHY